MLIVAGGRRGGGGISSPQPRVFASLLPSRPAVKGYFFLKHACFQLLISPTQHNKKVCRNRPNIIQNNSIITYSRLCSMKTWRESPSLNSKVPRKCLLWKNWDFLVTWEQKLSARGHWVLLEYSLGIKQCHKSSIKPPWGLIYCKPIWEGAW